MLNHKNILRFYLLILLSAAAPTLKAQENAPRSVTDLSGARPDIPGMLGLEFGWVLAPDFPEEMKLNFIGSVVVSPYYKYEFRIANSNFSIHPGIAFTSEKFSFNDNITLVSNLTPEGYVTELIGLDTTLADANIRKSKLNAMYFEIPLEITFRTKPDLPKRSVNITVGAKGGVLMDSKTKYTYRQDGQTKKSKQKERFDLNPWRVLIVGKIGYASVNLFYYYNFLPVFSNDKGPLQTQAQQMSFGISIDLF